MNTPKKKMFKVAFYFLAAEKIIVTFVMAVDKVAALDKVKFNYGSNDVCFPNISECKEF